MCVCVCVSQFIEFRERYPLPRPNLRRRSVIVVTVQMLPYETIQEASSALGRNLTTAETIWFNYSANKSDYFLYCHNIIFLFVVFSVAPFPLIFIELARLAGVDRYKIQPKVRLSRPEIFRCYKDVMRIFLLVVGPLQLVSYPSIEVCFFVFSGMRFGFAFGLCQISGFIDYFTILACWGFQFLCNCDCGVVKFGDYIYIYFLNKVFIFIL